MGGRRQPDQLMRNFAASFKGRELEKVGEITTLGEGQSLKEGCLCGRSAGNQKRKSGDGHERLTISDLRRGNDHWGGKLRRKRGELITLQE